jgi:UDP-glucuronate decarboxylase
MNLGNPQELSILQLAERVIELTGSRSKLVRKRLPSDDPVQRQPDISAARSTLKWKPSTSIDVGLKRTIEYFSRLLATPAKRKP